MSKACSQSPSEPLRKQQLCRKRKKKPFPSSGEVSTWNFESWNEPDHGDFGRALGNVTLDGFLNYYDATASAITEVVGEGRLRLGGPGGSCRSPNFVRFCHGLIDHCAG